MEGDIQSFTDSGYSAYLSINRNASGVMPPAAPPYHHSHYSDESGYYPTYYSEQHTVNHLMDSVHQSRVENGNAVGGTIQIRVQLHPKAIVPRENAYYPGRPIPPITYYSSPVYPNVYANPYLNRVTSSYAYQYPVANFIRSVVGGISQIEFAANQLRR